MVGPHNSSDPQDETRLENLYELITVAREFVSGAAVLAAAEDFEDVGEVDEFGVLTDLGGVLDPEADLAAGAAEPDPSLGAFLERVALVADSDQIPAGPDAEDAGVVTLMTLHTAKGLEFDNVFLTGLEDGIFPHQRALTDKSEHAKERRMGVGITRARKRPTLPSDRPDAGRSGDNPPSRFLAEIPDRLFDWRRTERSVTSWRNSSATTANRTWRNSVGYGAAPPKVRQIPSLVAGDRVLDSTFGMGKVVATSGEGDKSMADVDFGSSGLKRLSLKHAPL